MTSNIHKRLDKLRKEIAEIGAKGRAFHFIVGDKNEHPEAKLERLKAEGKIASGDEYQVVQVQWAINPLEGSSHIREGIPRDPYAEPDKPPAQQETAQQAQWKEERDREQRWKDHIKKIEASGQRYDPHKPKYGDGIV
jgi:hypothetical protein